MYTGVWEAKHKVRENRYKTSNFNNYPYFTNRIKSVIPDIKAVQIVTYDPLNEKKGTGLGIIEGTGGKVYNSKWDESLDVATSTEVSVAEEKLKDNDLDVLCIVFDDVDEVGHTHGFGPHRIQYMKAIEHVDSQIGNILKALKNRENYANEDWLIIVSTDHGGFNTIHGVLTDRTRHIFMIFSNDGLKKEKITQSDPGSFEIEGKIPDTKDVRKAPVLADVAVTALDHLLRGENKKIDDYYKEWDLDGKSWLSPKVITASKRGENEQFSNIKVYPTITKKNVHIVVPNSSNWSYTLIKNSGVLIDKKEHIHQNETKITCNKLH